MLLVAVLATVVPGCATTPASRESRFEGDPFVLYVEERSGATESDTELVHVYLEGDGKPFLRRNLVAKDPTSRDPLARKLMTADPASSIYLGRPCYHGRSDDPGCSFLLWTTQRYSETVVHSMTSHLKRLLAGRSAVLIGHSGGGGLAWLIGQRLPEATAVITIAGNLDTSRWTSLHGYSPLVGSINPSDVLNRQPPVKHIHLVGTKDSNIPTDMAHRFAKERPNGMVCEFAGVGHIRGWVDRWPEALSAALRGTCLE